MRIRESRSSLCPPDFSPPSLVTSIGTATGGTVAIAARGLQLRKQFDHVSGQDSSSRLLADPLCLLNGRTGCLTGTVAKQCISGGVQDRRQKKQGGSYEQQRHRGANRDRSRVLLMLLELY